MNRLIKLGLWLAREEVDSLKSKEDAAWKDCFKYRNKCFELEKMIPLNLNLLSRYEVEWSDSDKASIMGFLQSPLGIKLLKDLENLLFDESVSAARASGDERQRHLANAAALDLISRHLHFRMNYGRDMRSDLIPMDKVDNQWPVPLDDDEPLPEVNV